MIVDNKTGSLTRHMEIKVRPLYRILGLVLCSGFIIALPFMMFGESRIEPGQGAFFLVCSAFFVPIVLSSCILGKVPDFITRHLPDDWIRDWNESEKYFTEFNLASASFALLFLFLVVLTIFIYN